MAGAVRAPTNQTMSEARRHEEPRRKVRRKRIVVGFGTLASVALVAAAGTAWLGSKASEIDTELTAAAQLIPSLKMQLASEDAAGASATTDELRAHTAKAKKAADDPLWSLASSLPGVGPNFSAVAEVSRSADDVASLGLAPLVRVYGSLDWERLLPSSSGTDLKPLKAAAPSISAAANAVHLSSDRLGQIDTSELLPQVAEPITSAKDQLQGITGALDAAANAANLAPEMLGAEAPRNYLLMIQNNAEARASGGIPGALAILTLDNGELSLGSQSSASDVGVMSPTLPLDPEQQQIYTGRMGKFMQDVNLTPDFPTAASTARAMWEKKFGQRVDGVISIDPVALGYILDATGPVQITHPEMKTLASTGLPTELNGQNVVRTLLSDVYAKIQEPHLQDAYFAGVAQETFTALSDGKGEVKGLIKGLSKGVAEGRVLVWSGLRKEQSILSGYAISGSISGPSVAAAQFGAYFNDGTGAKMDFYVKRTVQLVRECPAGGYERVTVRITSTNTAPADAADSLPEYVTGGGAFGVAPGSVQTNIAAYGPVQANVESASVDGKKMPFAPYLHANRPVGVIAQQLAPGESKTVDITFGKIVQHAEPDLFVTPSVQPVKEVVLPSESTSCSDGS